MNAGKQYIGQEPGPSNDAVKEPDLFVGAGGAAICLQGFATNAILIDTTFLPVPDFIEVVILHIFMRITVGLLFHLRREFYLSGE